MFFNRRFGSPRSFKMTRRRAEPNQTTDFSTTRPWTPIHALNRVFWMRERGVDGMAFKAGLTGRRNLFGSVHASVVLNAVRLPNQPVWKIDELRSLKRKTGSWLRIVLSIVSQVVRAQRRTDLSAWRRVHEPSDRFLEVSSYLLPLMVLKNIKKSKVQIKDKSAIDS